MTTSSHKFNTSAEAEAFKAGIEFVNDSAVSIRYVPGESVVGVEDNDSEMEDFEVDHTENTTTVKPHPIHVFLDGLEASMDGRGWGKEHDEARRLLYAAPDLLAALKEAKQILEIAGRYFPPSVKNTDRFSLINVLANSVKPAIAKAKGA